MAVWPSSLDSNAWLRSSYRISNGPVSSRSRPMSGRSRQRRVIINKDINVSVGMGLTTSELAIFETFFFDEISGGADEFTGPFFDGGGRRTGTLQIVNGDYSVQRVFGDECVLSMNLRVINRAQQFASEIEDLLDGTITYEQYLAAVS